MQTHTAPMPIEDHATENHSSDPTLNFQLETKKKEKKPKTP